MTFTTILSHTHNYNYNYNYNVIINDDDKLRLWVLKTNALC